MISMCQSCGMPLMDESKYGTNKDGGQTTEYCCYCFNSGEFTQPNITKDEMIDQVAKKLVEKMGMEEEMAKGMALDSIPTLKRWAN